MGSCLSIHVSIEKPHPSIPKAAKGHAFGDEIDRPRPPKVWKIKTIFDTENPDIVKSKVYGDDIERVMRGYSKKEILSSVATWIEAQPEEERETLQLYFLPSMNDLATGRPKPLTRKIYSSICVGERLVKSEDLVS